MNKTKIKKQIEKLEEQIESEENTTVIKFKDKTFKIIKWTKQIYDFTIPKGFRMSEHYEFMELIDSNKFKILKYPNMYFTKNYSKLNIKKGWDLFMVCAIGNGLSSGDGNLQCFNDDGWVVVVK